MFKKAVVEASEINIREKVVVGGLGLRECRVKLQGAHPCAIAVGAVGIAQV